jgi:hypothetical protein
MPRRYTFATHKVPEVLHRMNYQTLFSTYLASLAVYTAFAVRLA